MKTRLSFAVALLAAPVLVVVGAVWMLINPKALDYTLTEAEAAED